MTEEQFAETKALLAKLEAEKFVRHKFDPPASCADFKDLIRRDHLSAIIHMLREKKHIALVYPWDNIKWLSQYIIETLERLGEKPKLHYGPVYLTLTYGGSIVEIYDKSSKTRSLDAAVLILAKYNGGISEEDIQNSLGILSIGGKVLVLE